MDGISSTSSSLAPLAVGNAATATISPVSFMILFSDFEEFYVLHRSFFDHVSSLWRRGAPIGADVLNYAQLMNKFAFHFIDRFQMAREHLNFLSANNPQFRDFLDQRKISPQSSPLDLKSLLSKPIGRLVYYKTMLEKYLDKGDGEFADFGNEETVRAVLQCVLSILSRLNSVTTEIESDRITKLRLMQQQVSRPGRFIANFVGIVAPHRGTFYLQRQKRGNRRRPYVLIFFDDRVMLARAESEDKFEMRGTYFFTVDGVEILGGEADVDRMHSAGVKERDMPLTILFTTQKSRKRILFSVVSVDELRKLLSVFSLARMCSARK